MRIVWEIRVHHLVNSSLLMFDRQKECLAKMDPKRKKSSRLRVAVRVVSPHWALYPKQQMLPVISRRLTSKDLIDHTLARRLHLVAQGHLRITLDKPLAETRKRWEVVKRLAPLLLVGHVHIALENLRTHGLYQNMSW